jgi:hypothetical protein
MASSSTTSSVDDFPERITDFTGVFQFRDVDRS